ncbi:oxygenase MpaB family protein [Streptomyces sp. NPDC048445]|uniref:oxygenase MpaB family protein n=1 Tax=Streptomyces sp. NPDC048445 TaxID=3365553 RepID=UPI003714AA27
MSSEQDPVPPPPGGVLWSLSGDIRALLMLPAALTLQVAHPAVGAGVDEYSVFRTDPWGRGERSLRSLQLSVYGGAEAAEEGRRLRRLRRTIRGTDSRGRPYRALSPANYAWVHAPGFPVYQHAARYLIRPLGGEQERALRRFCGVVRVVVPLLPERLRYLPRARRARAAHREARIRRKRAGSAGSA